MGSMQFSMMVFPNRGRVGLNVPVRVDRPAAKTTASIAIYIIHCGVRITENASASPWIEPQKTILLVCLLDTICPSLIFLIVIPGEVKI